jgi:uncharacterized membrane protein
MMKEQATPAPVVRLALVAVLAAVTALFTYAVRIPVAPTRGYINLGDVAIYFSAFTFGPITAFVAGGVGTAIADLFSGYSQWAPISLVVHGLQGLVAGLIAVTWASGEKPNLGQISLRWILAALAGTIIMCGGYLSAQIFMVGIGAALVELPGNVVQSVVGALGGIPLTLAVRKAYPPVRNLRW